MGNTIIESFGLGVGYLIIFLVIALISKKIL